LIKYLYLYNEIKLGERFVSVSRVRVTLQSSKYILKN